MNGIRLRNSGRVYEMFTRIAAAAKNRRGVIRLMPYAGSKLRSIEVDDLSYPGFGNRLPAGLSHKLNGSMVTLWYKAQHKATKAQIAKAKYATTVLKIPRNRYTGTLIDVFLHRGTLYCLLAGVLERDREAGKHNVNYRMMNLDDGTVFAAFISEPTQKIMSKGLLKTLNSAKAVV